MKELKMSEVITPIDTNHYRMMKSERTFEDGTKSVGVKIHVWVPLKSTNYELYQKIYIEYILSNDNAKKSIPKIKNKIDEEILKVSEHGIVLDIVDGFGRKIKFPKFEEIKNEDLLVPMGWSSIILKEELDSL